MSKKRDIIYPIFLECCQYADDAFWENIFEELAYGKAPYGTYISKNFLCCSFKKKEFNYEIEKKNAKTIFTEIYNLLTKKLGLLSQREKVKKMKHFMDLEETMINSRKEWSSIRKKNMKELLIEMYVIRMKIKHSLTIKQTRYLISIICIAIIFKVIISKDIDYSNGRINHIDGIDFIKNEIVIKRDLYDLQASFSPVVINKKNMSENWEKYLKDLRKT